MIPFSNASQVSDALSGADGMSLGLQSMTALMAELGNPQDGEYKTIHVAGTNGKGSVTAYIASALSSCGKTVGRYASPAVFDERETVTVNGAVLSDQVYTTVASRIFEAAEHVFRKTSLRPTRFELETAIAFEVFRTMNCSYAVIETGLGGRLDATNVIAHPALCVFTSVSLDHTAILGNNLAAVAAEKAGIMRAQTIVVSAPQSSEVQRVFNVTAAKLRVPILYSRQGTVIYDESGFHVQADGLRFSSQLTGEAQTYNLPLAWLAVQQLHLEGFDLSKAADGISRTRLNGRFERVGSNVVLDGAHNPAAARVLAKSLADAYAGKRRVGVVGIFKDKDAAGIAKAISPYLDFVVAFDFQHPRARSAVETATVFGQAGVTAVTAKSIEEALRTAQTQVGDDGVVVVFGSLSQLSAARKIVEGVCR